MNWLVLILISVVFTSVGLIAQKKLIHGSFSPIAFSIFFQLIISLFMGVYLIFSGSFSLANLPLVNLIIMAVIYGVGVLCYFAALQKIEASEFTILFSSRVIFGIIASYIFLQEVLSAQQILGTIFIIIAIIIVTFKGGKQFKFQLGKGEILGFITAFTFGLAGVNDNILVDKMNLPTFLFLVFLLPALFPILVFPKEIPKMKVFFQKNLLLKMLGIGILQTISALAFFAALQLSTNTPQLMVINLSSVVLTVILAIFFLKEKTHMRRKIISAVLTLIGLILMN